MRVEQEIYRVRVKLNPTLTLDIYKIMYEAFEVAVTRCITPLG